MSQKIVSVCNGKYVCEGDVACCYVEGIPKVVTNLNVTLEVWMYPDGDVGEAPMNTGIVFEPGMNNVLMADGAYVLMGVDCEALDGTDAPTDGTAIYVTCCPMDTHGNGDQQLILQALSDICAKLLVLTTAETDSTAIVTAIENNTIAIQELCKKSEDNGECLGLIKEYIGDPDSCETIEP